MTHGEPRRVLRQLAALRLNLLGVIFVIIGGVLLLPLLGLPFFWDERWIAPAFLAPSVTLIGLGAVFVRITRSRSKQSPGLSVSDGARVVVLSWLTAVVASTVPFLLNGYLDFVPALFETTSAWTTTGLSVVDVEAAPRILLLWRSIMQLAGGAGFAIIMISVVSTPLGIGVSLAEGRGDQLVPNVIQSAKLVVRLYLSYAVAGVVAYVLAGMPVFDAVNHSFAAVSTGGFSTRADSIGAFASPAIEWVSVPLMLLGNLNFLIAYALVRGRLRTVFRSAEMRTFLTLWVLLFVSIMTLSVRSGVVLRIAVFEATTALTTTGFSVLDYGGWNDVVYTIFIVIMLVGGGSGSTAGGIKQLRIYILFRAAVDQVRRTLLPRRAVTIRQFYHADQVVTLNDSVAGKTGVFAVSYAAIVAMGVLVMTAHGVPFLDAVFEFASTVGTVGLSIGVTAVDLPPAVLVSQVVGMLLGRLEVFMLFAGLFAILRVAGRR